MFQIFCGVALVLASLSIGTALWVLLSAGPLVCVIKLAFMRQAIESSLAVSSRPPPKPDPTVSVTPDDLSTVWVSYFWLVWLLGLVWSTVYFPTLLRWLPLPQSFASWDERELHHFWPWVFPVWICSCLCWFWSTLDRSLLATTGFLYGLLLDKYLSTLSPSPVLTIFQHHMLVLCRPVTLLYEGCKSVIVRHDRGSRQFNGQERIRQDWTLFAPVPCQSWRWCGPCFHRQGSSLAPSPSWLRWLVLVSVLHVSDGARVGAIALQKRLLGLDAIWSYLVSNGQAYANDFASTGPGLLAGHAYRLGTVPWPGPLPGCAIGILFGVDGYQFGTLWERLVLASTILWVT